jgi:hypothetical protein
MCDIHTPPFTKAPKLEKYIWGNCHTFKSHTKTERKTRRPALMSGPYSTRCFEKETLKR